MSALLVGVVGGAGVDVDVDVGVDGAEVKGRAVDKTDGGVETYKQREGFLELGDLLLGEGIGLRQWSEGRATSCFDRCRQPLTAQHTTTDDEVG